MTDASMQDHVRPRHARQRDSGEYRFYFALILLCAVPINLLLWPLGLVGLTRRAEGGPLRAAWEQACIVTPKIFWA